MIEACGSKHLPDFFGREVFRVLCQDATDQAPTIGVKSIRSIANQDVSGLDVGRVQ